MCYRWLHDKSEKHYHTRNLRITLPVIILTTLGGTANFGIQSIFSTDTGKQYASFVIGGISLFGGRGSILGTFFGTLIVGVMSMGLNMMGADPQWKVLLTGAFIIGAVAVDQWIRKVAA